MSKEYMDEGKYLKIRRDHNKMVNSGSASGEAGQRLAKLKAKQSSRKNSAGKGDQAGSNPHGSTYRGAVQINDAYNHGLIDLAEWRRLIKENKS